MLCNSQQATDAEPSDKSPDADVSKIRNVIQTAIDKYVADYYLSGLSTVYPSENNVDYYVCISASKFNEKNFWSGRWRSVYKVTVDSNDCKKAKLSGTMRVNVHYYESGNIQMNTSKEHGEQISGAGMEDLANAISASISKAETQFHTDIDNACTNLNETFKSLRRRLPLNKQLFVFDSNAHKIQQVRRVWCLLFQNDPAEHSSLIILPLESQEVNSNCVIKFELVLSCFASPFPISVDLLLQSLLPCTGW